MKKILFGALAPQTQEAALSAVSREEVLEMAKSLAETLRSSGGYSILITRGAKKVSVQELETGRFTVLADASTSKDTMTFCGRLLSLPSGEEQSIDSELKTILGSFQAE